MQAGELFRHEFEQSPKSSWKTVFPEALEEKPALTPAPQPPAYPGGHMCFATPSHVDSSDTMPAGEG